MPNQQTNNYKKCILSMKVVSNAAGHFSQHNFPHPFFHIVNFSNLIFHLQFYSFRWILVSKDMDVNPTSLDKKIAFNGHVYYRTKPPIVAKTYWQCVWLRRKECKERIITLRKDNIWKYKACVLEYVWMIAHTAARFIFLCGDSAVKIGTTYFIMKKRREIQYHSTERLRV